MGKKLFVGGLSWNTVDASLRAAFERFGEVTDAKVITDRETGRSRGFGFVTMADDAGSARAVTEMDGQPIDGRTVKVSEAQERAPRPGGFGGGGGGGYGSRPAFGAREVNGNRDFAPPAREFVGGGEPVGAPVDGNRWGDRNGGGRGRDFDRGRGRDFDADRGGRGRGDWDGGGRGGRGDW